MITSLTFGGEKIANWSVEDLCQFDTTQCYMLSFCGCRREMKNINDLLMSLPGFDAATPNQIITHDPS